MKRLAVLFILSFILFQTSKAQIWNSVDTVGGVVYSMHIYNNELVASGGDQKFGNVQCGIAKWNGSVWSNMDLGITTGAVYDYSIFNNDLIAGGDFFLVDTLSYSRRVVRWDGNQWYSMNTNCPTCNQIGEVYAVETYNGGLYVAGNISNIGTLNACNRIAKWDGSGWQHVGGGFQGIATIYCMAVYNGELYAGGEIYSAGGVPVNHIAKWNGTQWSAVGNGFDHWVRSLIVDTINNVLYAGGTFFNSGSMPVHAIAKWDGSTWSALDNGIPSSGLALCMYHNELYAGTFAANNTDTTVFRWDGSIWHPIVPAPQGTIISMAVYNDELYVGGGFYHVGNDSIPWLARYYSPPPNGLQDINKNQNEINTFPNPFNSELVIRSSEKINQIIIYDLMGEKVFEKELSLNNTEAELNLSFLQQGVYFLNVKSNGENWTRKIVKM